MTETNPTTNHKTIIKMGLSRYLPELEIIFEEGAESESSYGSYCSRNGAQGSLNWPAEAPKAATLS